MATTSATIDAHRLSPAQPALSTAEPSFPDAIAITRSLQSAVLRLRWTLAAMKSAADGEHENPHQERLFWPDLIDALAILTPDADVLDAVVDELRRLQHGDAVIAC